MPTKQSNGSVEVIVNRAFDLGAEACYSDLRPGHNLVMVWPGMYGPHYTGFQIRHARPRSRLARELLAQIRYTVEEYGERLATHGVVDHPDQPYHEVEIIPNSRELISCSLEESFTYDRTDGKHVEVSMAFIDTADPLLLIAMYRDREQVLFKPERDIIFNLEEARYLRELLNRPAVVAMLNMTKEELCARRTGITRQELDSLADLMDEEM